VVETVESAAMELEGTMVGHGSVTLGLQEEAGAVVGLEVGSFGNIVEAAFEQWLA
jgi:hypothetical protein